MAKIPFSVSARTARLIGQENFTNAEGAIVELVKNSYDADAKVCLVIYDISFLEFTNPLREADINTLKKYSPELFEELTFDEGTFHLTEPALKKYYKKIRQILWSQNSIFIIDNGDGMDDSIITKNWMTIGTGNKEFEFVSVDGRIKTGAKGIGRFALDRLGSLSEMWTIPKKTVDGFYWKMDWQQFETPGSSLADIKADLEPSKINILRFLQENFADIEFIKSLPSNSFSHGTVIKISKLRDDWEDSHLDNSFKNLEALIPPKELAIPFKVFQGHLQEPKAYGEVDTAFFNDYDYKVSASYNSQDLKVKLHITRNELDLKLIKGKFSFLYENTEKPYDLKTLEQKEFDDSKDINELMKWPKTESNTSLLKDVGDFTFSFYFLKNTVSSKEDYPFLGISYQERQKVISRFGGIKIYRDSFRVRPYGDSGNDWLKLGERAQRSPAGPGQRIGDWRVGPNQIAGIINISRVANPKIVDKSDRGSLVENTSFDLLKKIVESTIHYFEYDRSKILNPYYLYFDAEKKKQRQKEIQEAAEKIADELYAKRKAEEERNKDEDEDKEPHENEGGLGDEKEQFQRILEEKLTNFQIDDDKDAELAQVRSLASLGLIVSSFAHELREIRNNVEEIHDLETIYTRIVHPERKAEQLYLDGLNIIELLKSGGEKTKHWVDYSLTAIKKDKRKRSSFNFKDYFNGLKKNWEVPLNDRGISLEIYDEGTSNYQFRAFEIDMDTIFGNLITNSIDSFNNIDVIIQRKIMISHKLLDGRIVIIYQDNGTGLPDVFTNKNDIFLPFTTSKKDTKGNDIGTGLGMYLVKMVMQDNSGEIDILESDNGFCIKLDFPTRNN
ncbi:GHKL domain-containing protein [Pedobacter sp. KBS0701]|uniref:ATP-binding protein n=1 Tax=Pedobacter sp. KBS0701 TaxID=2578106 RepID=UPI00110E7789|nr:ATP-binding protein [Pedobacter sp. KBS0701]QDW27497.1 GHKL domain-containing protein [Pedobacter sp. KBS0701]